MKDNTILASEIATPAFISENMARYETRLCNAKLETVSYDTQRTMLEKALTAALADLHKRTEEDFFEHELYKKTKHFYFRYFSRALKINKAGPAQDEFTDAFLGLLTKMNQLQKQITLFSYLDTMPFSKISYYLDKPVSELRESALAANDIMLSETKHLLEHPFISNEDFLVVTDFITNELKAEQETAFLAEMNETTKGVFYYYTGIRYGLIDVKWVTDRISRKYDALLP